MSGTLGYVMSSLEAGTPFSAAVREAVKLGYAEPDPREDLSGADAMRKGLILARLLGFAGLAPRAQNLVSKAHAKLPLAAFMKRLPEADQEWSDLVATEASRGRVLAVGPVRIRIRGETKPCNMLDDAQPGLRAAMYANWAGGAFGEVLDDGEIRVGDEVHFTEEAP